MHLAIWEMVQGTKLDMQNGGFSEADLAVKKLYHGALKSWN